MSAIVTLFSTPAAVIGNWATGLGALLLLLRWGVAAATGSGGTVKTRFLAKLKPAEGQRAVFAVLRAFVPNLILSRQLMKSYQNTGTAIITRREDVLSVLRNDGDFEVVYAPRMREITDGADFFLGMQPSYAYTRDTSAMRMAMRASDVAETILPRATEVAEAAVAASGGRIDLVQDVGLKVSSDMVGQYFGLPGPTQQQMIDWTTILFWYLFTDIGAHPLVAEKAQAAMPQFRAYLDAEIAARKANPTDADDVLNRCLALQKAGMPGMDDLGVRNNIVGLMIGAVPTLSKAAALALEELFRHRAALRQAQKAAREDDDAKLAQIVWEALRFNPHQPVVYRRALRDVTIARSTLREKTIPKGTMVFAATLSAGFDGLDVPEPSVFRSNRPAHLYTTWGHGMHNCFGEAINLALIPAILKPVLKRHGLRYADGVTGIDMGQTPFPVHMPLAFDP
jgi:cytochrome P450